jgi:hypothetical protein
MFIQACGSALDHSCARRSERAHGHSARAVKTKNIKNYKVVRNLSSQDLFNVNQNCLDQSSYAIVTAQGMPCSCPPYPSYATCVEEHHR